MPKGALEFQGNRKPGWGGSQTFAHAFMAHSLTANDEPAAAWAALATLTTG
jgi:hypothetical protein